MRDYMKGKKNCFEGWYFRQQAKDFTCAFIPAISYDEEGRMKGSLQVVLPHKAWTFYYGHPVNINMKDSLFVVLDKNVFTDGCIHLDIDEPDLRIKGDIYFDDEPAAKFHVMGPLDVLPLPCKHKIWAMEQTLSGVLAINGKAVSFDGGKGYLEADYGRSFPDKYFWTHCNWFRRADLRITCAAAEMPVAGKFFRGCFACIDNHGEKIKLATYKGCRIEHYSPSGFRMRQGKYLLEGWKMEGTPVTLRSPVNGQLTGRTEEYLVCRVRYRLEKDGKVIFDEIGCGAAYEYR